jgi:hypothetical protein
VDKTCDYDRRSGASDCCLCSFRSTSSLHQFARIFFRGSSGLDTTRAVAQALPRRRTRCLTPLIANLPAGPAVFDFPTDKNQLASPGAPIGTGIRPARRSASFDFQLIKISSHRVCQVPVHPEIERSSSNRNLIAK